MSNAVVRANSIASTPCATSVTSSGKRVAARILRTMLRIVEESSTTSTRLGCRTRIARSRSGFASSRCVGLAASASVSNGTALEPPSCTVNGGLGTMRANAATRAISSLASAPSRNTKSTMPARKPQAEAAPFASMISIGTFEATAACRNRSRSDFDADATITRNKNNSSVMRSPPERVLRSVMNEWKWDTHPAGSPNLPTSTTQTELRKFPPDGLR